MTTRWSTWSQTTEATRGSEPYPNWVIEDVDATDHDLGVVKTGKEASVHLVQRVASDGTTSTLMAAKRYRARISSIVQKGVANGPDRTRASGREKRAIAKKSTYGRFLVRSEWAQAEFDFLRLFHDAGLPVPYPVQILETEILMEWIGHEDGQAAPRLIDVTLDQTAATQAFQELAEAMRTMARLGFTHGDLSPYNILYWDGHPRIIDVPQVVDIAKNPQGPTFLERDCFNVCEYFISRGVPEADPDEVFASCISNAWT